MKRIVLQGMAYDDKSSYQKGPALAPPLIRLAYLNDSSNTCAENGTDISEDIIEDKGDYSIKDHFEIERHTLENLREGLPLLTLGGDHSITYPLLKAMHLVHGPVDILHIDAHSDLYDNFEGDRFSHACPFARIMEEQLADKLVQVGIRTLNAHQRKQADKFGVQIIEMKDWDLSLLPEFKNPLYISLDIDALDPAFAPGVSHLEPGGFSTRQLLSILQSIKSPVIGADLVEFNPLNDLNEQTAMVCGKLFKELVALMIK
ncbi:agmatinase family protein [Zeaxanthinibacter enoshimensis]|uniref:Agmatinase n=1 Tax=Zeaxanthinibacter enoshimensis TaxID=392009 RepID=A0A4R6TLT5_9FLAO|nr:agmatinase family protein [Zeaxanthinibacter enoshimensis]TDQ31492.1 agmatinase [Zeaxanthinibacter enoshimensis]